jgi:hypothetical protein
LRLLFRRASRGFAFCAACLTLLVLHRALPQFESSFILSKHRRALHAKPEHANTTHLSKQFPFQQAECVHSCLADDYRFSDRHNAHAGGATAAARAAEGAFTVPIRELAFLNNDGTAPEAAHAHHDRRAALDIGPFTFPNLQSKRDKLDAAAMQIRTTVQNFLNLRVRATLTPFVSAAAVARFGTQIQQRLTGRPVEVRCAFISWQCKAFTARV